MEDKKLQNKIYKSDRGGGSIMNGNAWLWTDELPIENTKDDIDLLNQKIVLL